MESCFGARVRLEEVAADACLSGYHFIGCSARSFRETPNPYLQRKRLAFARHMPDRDERSVTDIGLDVVFRKRHFA
jgi:AraC family transcriptional regulator